MAVEKKVAVEKPRTKNFRDADWIMLSTNQKHNRKIENSPSFFASLSYSSIRPLKITITTDRKLPGIRGPVPASPDLHLVLTWLPWSWVPVAVSFRHHWKHRIQDVHVHPHYQIKIPLQDRPFSPDFKLPMFCPRKLADHNTDHQKQSNEIIFSFILNSSILKLNNK